MQTTRRFVVFLLLLIVCVASSGACPIPNPLPLRTLTAASELIVTAELGQILAKESKGRPAPVTVQFNIAQVVKGSLGEQSVNVRLWPFQFENLPQNTELLVFLRATPEGDGYVPAGEREESIKNLSPKALDMYRAQIKELLDIESLTDSANKQQQIVDWLVRCTEEPLTRWEGAYDLTYGQVVVGSTENQNARQQYRAFSELLTDEHKQRLLQTLYQVTRIETGELALLSLIDECGDENLIPFLWSYLKAGKQDDPYITSQLLSRVAAAIAGAEAEELVDQFETAIYGSDDEENPQPASEPSKALDEFFKRIESYGAPRLVVIKADER
jgi:hypothetical protein